MNHNYSSFNISRRQVLTSAAAGLSLFGLAACNNAAPKEQSTAASKELTHIDFVLDYTPNTNHTGIYVAQAKGYFSDAGLDVSIMQPPADGADALIGAGTAQIGVSYQDYIANNLASDNPLPYTAVAALIQHNTSGILSRKEDAIVSAKDMSHHSYATWDLPIEQATIKDVVELDGGDYSSITLVPYNVDDEVAALKSHLFDTVWVYEGWAVQNAALQHFDYNYFAFKDIDSRLDFYTPVLAANDTFAKEHASELKAFLSAVEKGYRFAIEHPEDAAQILLDAVPELDKDLVVASQNYLKDQYIADASKWGIFDEKRWATYYQWINDNKLVAKELDVKAGFTNEFLG